MTGLLFDLPETPAIPVIGEGAAYPVRRIFCVGRNYEAHAAELGNTVDREAPFYFTKSPAALALSGGAAAYPPGTSDYHFEVELVVALGAPLFRSPVEATMAAVYGYALGLDMTRRDLQTAERKKQRPWDLGKDVENSAVIGPITPAPGFAVAAQHIRLEVNGALRQDAPLTDMVWSIPEILAHLSGYYHLGPGDLIYTGTPAGVGPVAPGDRLAATLEGLAPLDFAIGPAE